jgi:hypothetical protein
MCFTDVHFIIAYRLLCEPDRRWTTLDFPDCHRPSVVRFFAFLIKTGVFYRKNSRGRNSYSKLVNPGLLLQMCIDNFRNNEEKVIEFVSKRQEATLINDLIHKELEFYLGQFSGIRGELIYSMVSGLSLLIPDRTIFLGHNLFAFQMDFKLYKVRFGGNITVILPRYKEFLRKYAITQDTMRIPCDFYTYLFLSTSSNAIALPQIEYMKKKLGGVNGNFLSWKRTAKKTHKSVGRP